MTSKINKPTASVVFEALLAEATEAVGRRMKTGKPAPEAIKEVADDMELTDDETEELTSRVDGPDAEADVDAAPVEPGDTVLRPYTIYFPNAEEAEQATGILMYRSVAWVQKGLDGQRPYIQFETQETLDEAHEALKRRWDFVDNEIRRVAVVEFDNVEDFDKVLEFMKRSGMFLEMGTPTGLVSDIEESEEIEPRSYVAKNKTDAKLVKDADAADPLNRQVKARRRWK